MVSRETLARLLDRLDAEPADLLRTTDATFRDREHAAATLNREAVVDLLQATPELMQRPVLDTGTRAVLYKLPTAGRNWRPLENTGGVRNPEST